MKNKIFPIIVTTFFLAIFLIFYKGLQKSNIYVPETNIGKNIPVFRIKTFDNNNQINSRDIFKKNKFYLMNIWSSWCVPCKNEHPFLMDLKNQNNLEIIGLNYKDNKINAQNFLKELGNPYKTIFFDENGIIAIEWGAYGVPETFLIYDEKIIKKIIGPLDSKSLLEIKRLIQ
tara:strand:+ start:823 stop:1341 length:519 start_codon:yes stop_codon:yes gene_type:complete